MGSRLHRRTQRQGLPLAWLLAFAFSGLAAALQAEPAGKTHVVEIEAMQFSPPILEVEAGDTVVWRNRDFFPHTATAEVKGFDSGDIRGGGSWQLKVERKGKFPYICTLHPGMKGVLVVK